MRVDGTSASNPPYNPLSVRWWTRRRPLSGAKKGETVHEESQETVGVRPRRYGLGAHHDVLAPPRTGGGHCPPGSDSAVRADDLRLRKREHPQHPVSYTH